jgi:hypothetical protein
MQGSTPSRAARRLKVRPARAIAALAVAGAGLALAPAALAAPSATLTVDHPGFQTVANASTFTAETIKIANTSTAGETITSGHDRPRRRADAVPGPGLRPGGHRR